MADSMTFILRGKLYDRLKFLAQIGLPAAGSAYFSLAQIWGLPAAEEVVGTVVIIDTLLGSLLGISSSQYNKTEDGFLGQVGQDPDTGMPQLKMTLTEMPQELMDKEFVRLRVGHAPPPEVG